MNQKNITINDEGMYQYFHSFAHEEDRTKETLNKVLKKKETRNKKFWNHNLTFYNIKEIYNTLSVIYSKEEVEKEICMIDDVLKIFSDFFKIPNLHHLLVNNYCAIENSIFLEHDEKSGDPKRIREHYKHQFRNVYLGSVLLLECGFLDVIINCIKEECNLYSEYIYDTISQEENDKNELLNEVVYKSFFIAALFHDIGYPLEYFLRIANQVHNYTPFFKVITPNIKTEFVEIKALLTESLLFQSITIIEIEEKYKKNDHGCLSAVSFLLNFYFSGTIHSLKAVDRCILELAAVAIFKHTNKYDGNNRMIFRDDPISYLLRICDDLQEWERFLLLINEKHNYLQCINCGKLVRCKDKNRNYECKCGKQFVKITDIQNKKVNYINICDNLELKIDKQGLIIKINYNYYKQIEIMLDEYTAIIYRNNSIKEVEKLLEYQKYRPRIKLEWFLSNNPILLIQKIMEENEVSIEDFQNYINNIENNVMKNNMQEFYSEYTKALKDDKGKEYGNQIEENELKYRNKTCEFVKTYLGQIYTLKEWLEKESGIIQ